MSAKLNFYCDHCEANISHFGDCTLIQKSVHIESNNFERDYKEEYHFCNMECLINFIIKRKDDYIVLASLKDGEL